MTYFLHYIVVIPGLLTDGIDLKQCNPDAHFPTIEKVASPGRVINFAATVLLLMAIDFKIISDIDWHILFVKHRVIAIICYTLLYMVLLQVYNALTILSLIEFKQVIFASTSTSGSSWRKTVNCSSAIVGRGVFLALVAAVDVFFTIYSHYKLFRTLILSSREHQAIFASIIASAKQLSHSMV